jgi:ribonuclease VapC
MIVDTSAVIAILANEPERPDFIARMAGTDSCQISAGSLIEISAVITRKHVASDADLQTLLDITRTSIAPITVEQAWIGYAAYRKFGIGSGHPARLNFGDCFAYALAKATGDPLLFKGDDFAQTDILAA